MTTDRSNIIDITAELRHETDKAFLVYNGGEKVWLPKSMVEATAIASTEYSQLYEFAMPMWLAQDKGLI